MATQDERSIECITPVDLGMLGALAADDREMFFVKRPEYRSRLLCTALCQGAALHYVDVLVGRAPPNGVKDFDVWSFFAALPGQRFPADRRMTHRDLGDSKFGRWPNEPAEFCDYTGRRVDFLMRALDVALGADPADALVDYLCEGRTKSSRELSAKAIVLIDPLNRRGEVVWPVRKTTLLDVVAT